MITSSRPIVEWDQISKNPLATIPAIDRIIHHDTIIEFGKEIPSIQSQDEVKGNQISFSSSKDGNT